MREFELKFYNFFAKNTFKLLIYMIPVNNEKLLLLNSETLVCKYSIKRRIDNFCPSDRLKYTERTKARLRGQRLSKENGQQAIHRQISGIQGMVEGKPNATHSPDSGNDSCKTTWTLCLLRSDR